MTTPRFSLQEYIDLAMARETAEPALVVSLRAQLALAISEQIRLSLEVLTLTNERDEARALGRMA